MSTSITCWRAAAFTNQHLFANLNEARQIIEEWRIDYNAVPVVSAAVGAVAGLPAGRFAGSHYTLMTRSSQIMSVG